MLSADATETERLEAAVFTFIKPAKMYDTAHDAWKTGEKAKDAGKGTGNGYNYWNKTTEFNKWRTSYWKNRADDF